jgi:Cytochrome P450
MVQCPLGRHPCAGMKIAKLEIKLILAMMLLGYEYELVDGNGNYPKAIPDQDRNDLLQVSSPVHVKAYDLMIYHLSFCLVAPYRRTVLSEIQARR